MKNIITTNEEETRKIGEKIGETCNGREVFLLFGDLGSGKTQLSKGIAKGLGCKAKVNSPTFNIMKVYRVRKDEIKYFCHVDAYRLDKNTDLNNVGLKEYLNRNDVVVVIEWPDNIEENIKEVQTQRINIEVINETKRKIRFV